MNKHHVNHEGFVFTRNSKGRVYSHAILVRASKALRRIQCDLNARESWRINHKHYAEMLDGTYDGYAKYPDLYPAEARERRAAEAAAFLEGGVEGLVARRLAAFDAYWAEAQLCDDGDTFYWCDGWVSRLDLAIKAAAKPGRFYVPAVLA